MAALASDAASLLEKERHARLNAAIAQRAQPRGVQWPCPVSALAADNDPPQSLEIQILGRTEHWLDAQEANDGRHCAKLFCAPTVVAVLDSSIAAVIVASPAKAVSHCRK